MRVKNKTRINPNNGAMLAGELLPANSPIAWTNTLAFYGRTPSQDEVNAHFDYLISEGLAYQDEDGNYHMTDHDAPVLYDFGAEAEYKKHYSDNGLRWDAESELIPEDAAPEPETYYVQQWVNALDPAQIQPMTQLPLL